MKKNGKKNEKAAIAVALAVAVVLIAVPLIVLETADKDAIADFEASLIIIAVVGVAVFGFALLALGKYIRKRTALASGRRVIAKYVGCECKASTSSKEFYSVTYSYDDGGEEQTCTSSPVYTWDQALALKFEENFEIAVYGKSSFVTADLSALVIKHMEKIGEYKSAYMQAFREYHSGK